MKTEDVIRLAIRERAPAQYVADLARILNGGSGLPELEQPAEEVVAGFFPDDWRKLAEKVVKYQSPIRLDDLRVSIQARKMGQPRAVVACRLLEDHIKSLEPLGYAVRSGYAYSGLAIQCGAN